MALRRMLGYSDGELMRSDAKPCSRLMRQTAGIFSVGGALGFWILCRLHYGSLYIYPSSVFNLQSISCYFGPRNSVCSFLPMKNKMRREMH